MTQCCFLRSRRMVCRTLFVGLALLGAFGLGQMAQAHDYYLSSTGSDSGPGSQKHPWQTPAKVNATTLQPGDRVLLAGGDTFTGSLTLTDQEAGTPGHPILLGSFGKGRATLLSPEQTAISAVGGGITIQNLVLKGTASQADKTNGLSFFTDSASGVPSRNITIDHVEVTGFGGNGIVMGTGGKVKRGYENVKITHADVHDNYGTGIITYDNVEATEEHANRDFTVADSVLSHNHDGTGMVLSGIDHGVVEFCRAYGNDGKGGGVGLWAYAAKDITFRYCIASGTRSGGGDGGGFDLDGDCVGCKVVSCLTYDNDGPGYMHCDYPSAPPTRDNVIQNSISVNDGRKLKGGPYGFGLCTWGSGLDNCSIDHNLTMVTVSDPEARSNGVLWVAYIPESAGDAQYDHHSQHIAGCVFRDNTAYVTGTGVAYVSSDDPGSIPAKVGFEDNSFLATPGISPVFMQDKKRFDTEDSWQAATGQKPDTTHKSAHPLLGLSPALADALAKITDPHQLPKLAVMQALNER